MIINPLRFQSELGGLPVQIEDVASITRDYHSTTDFIPSCPFKDPYESSYVEFKKIQHIAGFSG